MRRRRSFLRYLSSCKPGENAATEMWFVFPQLRRLGRSSDGIGSLWSRANLARLPLAGEISE